GGLVALGATNDWLDASLPEGGRVTLNVTGSGFGSGLLVFAGVLAILGLWRLSRGYSDDETVQRLASLVAVVGLLVVLVRIELFLSDHGFAVSRTSTYSHVGLQPGLYFLGGGLVLGLLTRFG
ncbi:MAG: hypothetical protein ACXVZW_09325, partial [Gaiellaceae bacterium]